jgi:hypothetical protein
MRTIATQIAAATTAAQHDNQAKSQPPTNRSPHTDYFRSK